MTRWSSSQQSRGSGNEGDKCGGADHYSLDDIAGGVSLDSILAKTERAYIMEALSVTGDSKSKAAALLGITFRSLRYRLSKLELDR